MEQKFEGINNSKIIDLDKEKTKKIMKNILYIIAGIILFLILFNSFTFTVDEREQVIVTQFDRIVRAVVDDKSDTAYKTQIKNAMTMPLKPLTPLAVNAFTTSIPSIK
jgi:hypothetical protein